MHSGRRLLTRPLFASARNMLTAPGPLNTELKFEHIRCSRPADWVVHVELNRPEKRNALSPELWAEIGACFASLQEVEDCRAVVLSGAGKAFCAGLDFTAMAQMGSLAMDSEKDVGRKFKAMKKMVKMCQDAFTYIEACQKPVIAAIHGACVGAGMGIATACDVRYGAADGVFSIREVDIGLSADVGTLQRMPHQIASDSLLREIAFTARDFYADEALRIGLLSRVLPDQKATLAAALALAKDIAGRSPVAVQGTKVNLNYARDHSVQEALDYHSTWNAANLLSEDTAKTAMAKATRQKDPVIYAKL